jgi:two-component system response regulator PilR (NtrC family)
VRELENIVERAVALARGPVLGLQHLPIELAVPDGLPVDSPAVPTDLKTTLRRFETQLLLRVLESTGWSYGKARDQLGIHRNTLRYRLEALGIARAGGAECEAEPPSQ